jgi:hypothetical protein
MHVWLTFEGDLLCIKSKAGTPTLISLKITCLPLATRCLLLGTIRLLGLLFPASAWNTGSSGGPNLVKSLVGGVWKALWGSVYAIVACRWVACKSRRSTPINCS